MSKPRKGILFIFDDKKDYDEVLKGLRMKKTLDYNNGSRVCDVTVDAKDAILYIGKSKQRLPERLRL